MLLPFVNDPPRCLNGAMAMGGVKMDLSEKQRRAVTSESPALLILAGPGTGKTRVLIERIFCLIERGISPSQILAVTFSRKATEEMSERLEKKDAHLASEISVSTLHALCFELVERHGFRIGLGRRLQILNEAQAFLFLKRLAPQLPILKVTKTSFIEPILNDLLSFFQDCKDEGLWPEDVIRYAESLPDQTEDERSVKEEWVALADTYNLFQNHCFEEGFIDFGDAILGAVRLMEEHPLVRKEMQSQFREILVDEFQDTNWIQIRLLRLLTAEESGITAVGDDDQSIYRFRGASYSAFQFFEELFSPIEVVELNETYRLSPSIAATASALIQANGQERFRPEKLLISQNTQKTNPVSFIEANDYTQEAEWVADKIEALLSEGCPPEEIAVLVRSYSHAQLFLGEAEKRGLPIFSLANQALFDEEIIEDALAYLRLLIYPKDTLSLIRLLDSPFIGLPADEIYSFCRWSDFESDHYLDRLERIQDAPLSPEAKAKLSRFFSCFKLHLASSGRKRASEILFEAMGQFQVIAQLREGHETSLQKLAQFLNRLVEWESLQEGSLTEVFSLLEAIAEKQIRLTDEDADVTPKGCIQVLSVHASKGLEFRNVFVLSLVSRRFPSNFRKTTWMLPNEARKEKAPDRDSHKNEERRLFYVAATRAKDALFLTGIRKKGTKPSGFIELDIPRHLNEPSHFQSVSLEKPEVDLFTQESSPRVFERARARSEAAEPPLKEKLRLSFTQLDKYETCPQQYFFGYELRIPVSPSPSLTVGSAVHDALERFYKEIAAERTPSKDDLIRFFTESFEKENAKHRNCTTQDLERGQSGLAYFYDSQHGRFAPPRAIEAAFSIEIESHRIIGKIDRVDQGHSGVVIIDYKTGKSKSNDSKDDQKWANESLQFSIYALAARDYFGWEVEKMQFHYIYDGQILETNRAPEQLEATKERILNSARRIQKREFAATPGFHCQFCEYRKICPESQV